MPDGGAAERWAPLNEDNTARGVLAWSPAKGEFHHPAPQGQTSLGEGVLQWLPHQLQPLPQRYAGVKGNSVHGELQWQRNELPLRRF